MNISFSHIAKRTLLLLIVGLTLSGGYAAAGDTPDASFDKTQRISLVVGRSAVLASPVPVSRVALASPEVADIRLLSPRQIYLGGKAPGATNLTLWNKSGKVSQIYDITVQPDVSRLKAALHQTLPEEQNIRVIPSGPAVTLSGTVSSLIVVAKALALAETVSPGKVVNMLQVGGAQQVLLEVKVAEMSRSAMKRLGVNLTYLMNGEFAYTFLNNMVGLDSKNGNLGGLKVTDSINGLFRFNHGGGTWTGFLDALKQDGLVKILAEPNLICLSGKAANFLAGGEIPIPVPQGLGTTAIEYKQFGVGLKFKPVVLGRNRISIEVAPEVSELDYTNSVNVNGFIIPGLSTRKASTTVELGDGQSFAIAGLLKDNVREVVDKYPGIGEIPILGALFRSTSFIKNESELVIIVTPRLAKPLDMANQSLPTDSYTEPSEAEFFLLGQLQGSAGSTPDAIPPQSPSPQLPANPGRLGGLEGGFGQLMPGQ